MDDGGHEERIEASRERSIETLRRTIDTLERMIGTNRALAENPDHRDSARERIAEGEAELYRARRELALLEAESQ